MQIKIENPILPIPNEELLLEEEKMWRVKLPFDYRDFLLNTNGGCPDKKEFRCQNHNYMIESFLCILQNSENRENGFYDIDVVLSQIEDRLTDNEDLVGCELLPIAELFAGDYLCLDFTKNADNPFLCIWDHEKSDELEPVTYKVADSFSEFITLLE